MRRLVLSMLAAAGPVAAQQPQPSPAHPGPDIITSATGEARVTPDRAHVLIGVQTRAATAAQAGADNATKTRAVIEAIRGRGIPAAQIGTSEYNLYPEYDHREPREGPATPRVIGYVANNTVRVEVRELNQVGAVIDAALAAGANMVNTIQFFASNVDAARRSALAEAVGRARADAEALARAAGGSLGALLELNTQSPPVRPLYAPERLMRMDAGGGAAQTPIEPGQQTLMVWVGGRWAFVPGSASR